MTADPDPSPTSTVVDRPDTDGAPPFPDRRGPFRNPGQARLRWWLEILLILAFYLVYTAIRNRFGSATVGVEHALNNAEKIIDLEQKLSLFVEREIQEAFLDSEVFIQFWNVFYGTFHFGVTIFAMVWTYVRFPHRYSLWRNTLAATTALALIGFALFPLMPPRLLDAGGPFGAMAGYGFVDTLAEYGGLWSFDSGTMQEISNQYAAMPSLHFAWALWCFLVLFRYLPWTSARVAIALYPPLTLFAIVVTGNHYWIDAVGGAAVLLAGFLVAQVLTGTADRIRAHLRAP